MDSALDFANKTSPYLQENIRFILIKELINNQFYVDAVEFLDKLNPSVATIIPLDFNAKEVRNKLANKIKTLTSRGLDVKMNIHGYKNKSKDEEDYWEVDHNS